MKYRTAIGALAVGAYLYNRNQTRTMRVRTPVVAVRNVREELRITQISDFHNNRYVDPFAVASEVRVFSPDLIALTGDLISEGDTDFTLALTLVQVLVQTGVPVFAVPGNHEDHNRFCKDFCEQLKAAGAILLRNETRVISLRGQKVALSGIDFEVGQSVYDSVMMEAEPDALHILLCHSPSHFRKLQGKGPDLVLSGHTHGGQVRLPFIGAIIVPSQGFFAPVNKGFYTTGETVLHIDSGLGNTRLDLRTFNPIQFTNMRIVAHR